MLSFIFKSQVEFRRPESAYTIRRPSPFQEKTPNNRRTFFQKVIPDLQNIIRQLDSSALDSLLGEASIAISRDMFLKKQEQPETR